MKKTVILLVAAIIGIGLFFGLQEDRGFGGSINPYTSTEIPVSTTFATTSITWATSTIDVENAKKVTVYLSRTDATSVGTSTFDFDASIDGSTYLDYNKMVENTTNSNSQDLTRVAQKQCVGSCEHFLSMDLTNDAFTDLRIILKNDPASTGTLDQNTIRALIQK